jgi:hypothetical protein
MKKILLAVILVAGFGVASLAQTSGKVKTKNGTTTTKDHGVKTKENKTVGDTKQKDALSKTKINTASVKDLGGKMKPAVTTKTKSATYKAKDVKEPEDKITPSQKVTTQKKKKKS